MSLPRLLLLAAASLGISAAGAFAQVSVTATGGTSSTYATLRAAFTAINAGTHTGDVTISLTANTAEGANTAQLEASGTGAASYTSILIRPSSAIARTISGNPALGNGLIVLNGARNVTIDGQAANGGGLVISNTTAGVGGGGTSTIRLTAGAANNTITRVTVYGSFAGSVSNPSGNILFDATPDAAGNGCTSNTVSLCNLGSASATANLPSKCISATGPTTSAAAGSNGNVITGNNFSNYFLAGGLSAGCYVGAGCAGWTISNNRFFQTNSRAFSGTAQHAAIWVESTAAVGGAQDFTITGNVIGYANANATPTGTYTLTGGAGAFAGIRFAGFSGGTLSTISGNTVTAVSYTGSTGAGALNASPFTAIRVAPGNAEVNDNVVGSLSATTAPLQFTTTSVDGLQVYGILSNGADTFGVTANNNQIGGITVNGGAGSALSIVAGIRAETAAGIAFNAAGNQVGGTASGAGLVNNVNSTGAEAVGIFSETASCSFTANTVQSLSARGANSFADASVTGLRATAPVRHAFLQNVVAGLSNATTGNATSVIGLYVNGSAAGPGLVSQNVVRQLSIASQDADAFLIGLLVNGGANTVERNFIHSFASAPAGQVNGILIRGGGTGTYRNNMIRLGILPAAGSDTAGTDVYGIHQLSGTDRFLFNSVYLGGTGVTGSGRTAAMLSNESANPRVFQNNIFVNARSNAASGTGQHYAIIVENNSITSDYNIFQATGTGGIFGARAATGTDFANLAAWQAGVGVDAHSFQANPQFRAPTGGATSVDLHISATAQTPVERGGLAIADVADDFDGQVRANLSPTDIGADAGDFVAVGAPPFAGTLSVTGSQGRPLAIPTADILAVCSDPMGLALTVVSAGPGTAQGGTATLGASAVTYAPPSPSFIGSDVFAYSIQNSAGRMASGVVNVAVQAPAFPPLAANVTLTPGATAAFAATFRGGVPNLAYAIESTDSLTVAFQPLLDANGQPVVVTADGSGAFSFNQAATPVPQRFYRARRQP